MAVRAATFTGFDPYKLTGVTVTDKKLGHGSYATVLELEYMGLKCAGKKIHELLLEQGDASYTVLRFEKECRLLSQVRHPNIVQFLGVYFQEEVRAPILVMELLPTNLTSCIEQYGILPKEISYSILQDVALGLCYLHSQTPPIIHRDLSSNNVLLTPNMTAKISDLGVARIFKLTPLQVSRMTQTPGTPAYMPPEVMVANPKYDTSVDEFSYGIMMIHMFSGQWPEPQIGPNRIELDGRLIPVTEAERRDTFLQIIGQDHPLMDTILKCISNEPKDRISANIVYRHVAELKEQFSATFANRIELLTKIATQEEEKCILREESQEKQSEIDIQSLEIKQLQLQIKQLNTQNQLDRAESMAKVSELKTNATLDEDHITTLLEEKTKLQQKLILEKEQFEKELTQKEEACTLLITENSDLHSKISNLEQENTALKEDIGARDDSIHRKDATIDSRQVHLEAKTKALNEKDLIISEMNEQLSRAREYLINKQKVLLTSFTWKECAELPGNSTLFGGTTAINGRVYFIGILSADNDTHYVVHCYDPSQDKWTTLPPLPLRGFSVGQVNGELVVVGGTTKSLESPFESNEVHTYDEQAKTWKQTIPPMPTARYFPGVLSLQSALIVAGGACMRMREPGLADLFKSPFSDVNLLHTEFCDVVEIFKLDTLQWCTATPLPNPCQIISLIEIGNTCYALGGYRIQEGGNGTKTTYFNQALHASVDDLLGNAVPANQTTHNGSSDTQSAWKTLPNTPTYGTIAAELAGNLLAIGMSKDTLEIYMHVTSTNSWVYIGALPSQNYNITVASLSPIEILIITGNSVYKGTPMLFK